MIRSTPQVPARFAGLAASLDWGFFPGPTALAAGLLGIGLKLFPASRAELAIPPEGLMKKPRPGRANPSGTE